MKLFLTEARREFLLLLRYPYQTLFANGFLLLLYFGFRLLPPSMPGALDLTSDTTVVGYIVWTTLAICLAHLSSEIERDIQAGTIDRMLLSSYPLLQIAVVRTVLGLIRTMASIGFVLLGLWLLDQPLPGPSILFAAIAGAAAFGSALGMIFGGLSLIIRPVAMLQMPICLLLLMGTAMGAAHARTVSLSKPELALLSVGMIAALWAASIAAFRQLERIARRAGTIKRS